MIFPEFHAQENYAEQEEEKSKEIDEQRKHRNDFAICFFCNYNGFISSVIMK